MKPYITSPIFLTHKSFHDILLPLLLHQSTVRKLILYSKPLLLLFVTTAHNYFENSIQTFLFFWSSWKITRSKWQFPLLNMTTYQGFPDTSVGKKFSWSSGDFGLIPRSGRSLGEEIVYPHQYSWASLVAQPVKNLAAMQETWVRPLGWEDPLEKGTAAHSSILTLTIHNIQSMGLQRVGHNWVTFTSVHSLKVCSSNWMDE